MTEIISFYSVAASQGKRTLSLAFANLLAKNNHSVLYVELDTHHPSVANATRISHPKKNAVEFFQETITRNDYNVEPFVLNRDSLTETGNRDLKRVFSEIPNMLDYLVLPNNFHINSFPNLISDEGNNPEKQAQDYIQKLLYSFKTSKYHYVILNLPNDLQNIFGFEVIDGSDLVLNVTTASANRLYENKKMVNYLSMNMPDLESRWKTIINMASPYVEEKAFAELISDQPFVISFDPERHDIEFSLENGSPIINERLEKLAIELGIQIELTPQRKQFSLFKRGS